MLTCILGREIFPFPCKGRLQISKSDVLSLQCQFPSCSRKEEKKKSHSNKVKSND